MSKFKYTPQHNDGLSMYPTSLIIEIKDELDPNDIFDAWEYISEQELGDIIFHGEIQDYNKTILNMLMARLICAGFNVSVIISEITPTSFIDLMANNIIVFFKSNLKNSTSFKKNIDLLKSLREKDTIILAPKSIKELVFVTNYFITNEIKSRVMVAIPSEGITSSVLMENNLYDLSPYYGRIY